MISVHAITRLHREMVIAWHHEDIFNPYNGFLRCVCEQHKFNFLLWHEEDIARSPDSVDARIAAVKRNIDRYNQCRNNWIERLDDELISALNRRKLRTPPDARWNTESPGSVIDRLSILSLRIYHMKEQAYRADAGEEHCTNARHKHDLLCEQHVDLTTALSELLADIFAGRKRLKVYRQFKMYNDPALNPYLYHARRPVPCAA